MSNRNAPTRTLIKNDDTITVEVYWAHTQLGWIAKIVDGYVVEQFFPRPKELATNDNSGITRTLEFFAFGDSKSEAIDALSDRLFNLNNTRGQFPIAAKRMEVKESSHGREYLQVYSLDWNREVA